MKRQGSSLRNYLFYGLTLMLASAFIFLAIQNHRSKIEPTDPGKEAVQGFQSTQIRALDPQDLKIIPVSVPLNQSDRAIQNSGTRRYTIEIHNSGHVSYGEIQIKREYLDAGGTALSSTTQNIVQDLPPGKTSLAVDISMNSIPSGSVHCRFSVIYADMEME